MGRFPISQRVTVFRCTPSRRANSSCVRSSWSRIRFSWPPVKEIDGTGARVGRQILPAPSTSAGQHPFNCFLRTVKYSTYPLDLPRELTVGRLSTGKTCAGCRSCGR